MFAGEFSPGSVYTLAEARRHLAEAPFDVITMIDVVEHLPDPAGALRWAASLAATGATIVLLTPRYGGRLLAEQKAGYVHFDSDHMYYFTEETLRAVLARGAGQSTASNSSPRRRSPRSPRVD
ncbi:methyltransferase domain-containing protein [Actinomadura mexicana]|uniref:Methyltransferase domain-containing protein n=1 Tax=Actinomadura mexicana TaxID=134959 RepID=A0A239EQN7_9ACTN|nr:methyltransferase domain-containing protein [Actinomadura mexicana]SNS46957.1 Methyltransferase domain-containing protein [Actinomadura mexicana]